MGNQYREKGARRAFKAPSMDGRTALAWLLPIGLVGSYFFIAANPNSIRTWSPIRSITRQSQGWQIKTPADIELLIEQAQADQQDADSQEAQGNIRAIASKLLSKGVTLLVSSHVPAGAGGVWDPSRAEVRLAPSTVSMGPPVLSEALAHESAHVAQSCRAGGLGKNSEPMGIEVDPVSSYRNQLSSSLYAGPPANKAIEVEAFSVGLTPEWAPQLLDHYCK